MSCAPPAVAAEAGTSRSGVLIPTTKSSRRGTGRMGCGAGFLAGMDFGGVAATENVEGGRGRCRGGEAGGVKTRRSKDGFKFAGADHSVDFGDALANFVAITLDEAAGDDELLSSSSQLVAGHFENGVDGLLLGGVNEAAGVDDEDFGLFRMSGQPHAGAVEQAHHHLGIDEVLRTA